MCHTWHFMYFSGERTKNGFDDANDSAESANEHEASDDEDGKG